MCYVPELELPVSGCVLQGATKAGGADSDFDGDEAEMTVFEEAQSETVKKKSSHVMKMTSFLLSININKAASLF